MPLKLVMGEPGPTTTIGAKPKMPTGTKSLIGSNGKERNMAQAILHAEWLEDQDISSPETLQTIARSLDLDGEALLCQAASPVIKAEYRRNTDNAISAGVFGSPAYVYRGEVFWGQDRLDFLEDTLACT